MQQQVLGLVNPAVGLLFAGAFFALWLQDKTAKHALAMVYSYIALALAALSFHLAPYPNAVLSVLVVHGCYSAASIGLCWAMCRRAGARINVKVMIGVALAAAVAVILSSIYGHYPSRLYATNTSYGIQFLLATQALSRASRTDALDKFMLWLMVFATAQFFIRPFTVILLGSDVTASEYRESAYYAVTMLTVMVTSLMLAMVQAAAIASDMMRTVKAETEADILTGVKSRRAFEEDAVALLDSAREKKIPVSIIVADIDHFKQVNDIWGHQVGDRAIATFGKLLSDSVRITDPVGRVGGEEFCILVWDCEGGAAARLAERIRFDFTKCKVDGMRGDFALTSSFGVAEWKEGEAYGKLFARADAALYAAKTNGRNKVETASHRRRGSDQQPDTKDKPGVIAA